mgnify:CR=1 FL=1
MDTREKVFAYIREHHMLQAGDRVVAGVSGGADSVCLLFLLLEWMREFHCGGPCQSRDPAGSR